MFRVGDRVKNRYVGGRPFTGSVIGVNGRWITVRHDRCEASKRAIDAVSSRFDYLEEELEHVNPLLKLAQVLVADNRP